MMLSGDRFREIIMESVKDVLSEHRGYGPEARSERLRYLQSEIARLKYEREVLKNKIKEAPEGKKESLRTKRSDIVAKLNRLIASEHNLRVGRTMSDANKSKAKKKYEQSKLEKQD